MKRVQWNVLDWNEPAKVLYKKMGAYDMVDEDWLTYRLPWKGIEAIGTGKLKL